MDDQSDYELGRYFAQQGLLIRPAAPAEMQRGYDAALAERVALTQRTAMRTVYLVIEIPAWPPLSEPASTLESVDRMQAGAA